MHFWFQEKNFLVPMQQNLLRFAGTSAIEEEGVDVVCQLEAVPDTSHAAVEPILHKVYTCIFRWESCWSRHSPFACSFKVAKKKQVRFWWYCQMPGL